MHFINAILKNSGNFNLSQFASSLITSVQFFIVIELNISLFPKTCKGDHPGRMESRR